MHTSVYFYTGVLNYDTIRHTSNYMVRHPRCVFINYNCVRQLINPIIVYTSIFFCVYVSHVFGIKQFFVSVRLSDGN